MRRYVHLVLVWVALAQVWADPALGSRNDVLRLAVETNPVSLDAAQLFSNEQATLGSLLFNNLVDPGPGGGVIPSLAESLPEQSADGRTLTFRLRPGVRFSDGGELTAEDVVFTFERMFDPRSSATTTAYFRSLAGNAAFEAARRQEAAAPDEAARHGGEWWIEPVRMAGLRALDRYTVEFRLEAPDLAFLSVLATPPGGIVSKAAVKRLGRSFAHYPVGTGPFRIVDWFHGARIRMEPNPHYFRPGPRPSAVDVQVAIDRPTQTMLFERGEIDFQYYIPDADILRIRRQPSWLSSLQTVKGAAPQFVFLNCELPPFTNRLVREALNLAVDRHSLARRMLHRAEVARGPVPLPVRGFNRDLPDLEYNPDKARELLTKAGYPDGFKTTLWSVRENPTYMRLALMVQQYLREIGVVVELKEVSFPVMLESNGRRHTVPMGMWDWLSAYDDPKESLDSLLNGDTITEELCMNNAFYSNPQVQQWFRDAVAESDPARRLEFYRKIERQVVQDYPWIFLVHLNTDLRVQPWVKGFQVSGFWPPARFDRCWIER